jgi:hypothetical protein
MLDLRAWGPTVIEAPPGSLCVVDDFWFRYFADMGIGGPDQGKGGKYLYLPPGYDGEVPDGYYTYRCPTFTNWVVLRALGGVPAVKQTMIYPLAEADNPDENVFINFADRAFDTVHANDFTFYEELDELVQEEPIEALDAERAGQLTAIGIVKGQPFAPGDRMRAILENAARIGGGMARAIGYAPRDPGAVLYGSWKNAFVGGSHEFLRNGARLLDARTHFHYLATVITPAMAHAQVGAGSAYAHTVHDANGELLDGAKTYRLHVDPDPPAKNFWAVDVYDTQTRSLIQVASTIHPALASNSGTLQANDDGSCDLTLDPRRPPAWRPTGSRRSQARRGFSSSGSTVRCNHGSTRRGSSTSSSPSTEHPRATAAGTVAMDDDEEGAAAAPTRLLNLRRTGHEVAGAASADGLTGAEVASVARSSWMPRVTLPVRCCANGSLRDSPHGPT